MTRIIIIIIIIIIRSTTSLCIYGLLYHLLYVYLYDRWFPEPRARVKAGYRTCPNNVALPSCPRLASNGIVDKISTVQQATYLISASSLESFQVNSDSTFFLCRQLWLHHGNEKGGDDVDLWLKFPQTMMTLYHSANSSLGKYKEGGGTYLGLGLCGMLLKLRFVLFLNFNSLCRPLPQPRGAPRVGSGTKGYDWS
jgi:hypothetical protein